MTATETSAVTWGETRVSYSIRRSARRQRPGRGSGTPHQEPARRDCESEGRLDRAADQTRGGQRLAAVTSRVRQRRERAVSRATLSPEGSSARNRRRQAARRVAPHARTGGSEANGPHPIRTRLVVPGSGRPGSLLTLAPHRSGRAGSAASGSSTDSFATRRRVPAGPGSQAMATAIPTACLASSAIRCRDVETGPNLGVLAVFPSTGATCRCPLPSTGSRGLNSPASAVL